MRKGFSQRFSFEVGRDWLEMGLDSSHVVWMRSSPLHGGVCQGLEAANGLHRTANSFSTFGIRDLLLFPLLAFLLSLFPD